jgi:hypothetical protein
MKKILVLMAIMIFAIPVLADINQKADFDGGNIISVKVSQIAFNYGSGDINQYMNVDVSNNIQMSDQDSIVVIVDNDFEGNVTTNLKGINLIKLDLDQFANNTASGNISQGIEVQIEGNMNILDQGGFILI